MYTRQDRTKPAIDRLLDEIRRYLEAVDAFRRQGCEPRWLAEN